MPIDRPRHPADAPNQPPNGDTPRQDDQPRPRDAPPPPERPADPTDSADRDADPVGDTPDSPAARDGPSNRDNSVHSGTWARSGDDPEARYQRALDATAPGDALLDDAGRALTAWSARGSDSVATYWRTGRETQAADTRTDTWQEPGNDTPTESHDDVASSVWDIPAVKDHPDRPAPETIRLEHDRHEHILDRHSHGAGHRGRTEFPKDWNSDTISAKILDVARQPDHTPQRQDNGRWQTRGVRDGVTITSIVDPDGSILTGYPKSGGPGVVKNT